MSDPDVVKLGELPDETPIEFGDDDGEDDALDESD